ncbi:MAG: hypothetical protein IT267_11855 [Saprospiraceae bacterium]|nr:hypothetical protein [Saprospiraceae bacterium]
MFTINIYLKFAIIFIGLIGGVILWWAYGFWYAFPFMLIGILMLVSYLMLGTIQSASQLMQKMDYDACLKRLNLTLSPKLLYVTNRAYYYLIKGSIEVQRGDKNDAEFWFNKASALKLPTDNERAMILMQMINIQINKNQWTQANNSYRELKKLKITTDLFKEQIDMLDQAFKQQGKVKMSGQMDQRSMFRPGGKRRMPRMR